MRAINLAAFAVLYSLFCYGQNRSFATLPIVKSDTIIGDLTSDLNQTAEYERLLDIYERLVEARGDYRLPVPKLFLRNVEGMVAKMDPVMNEITMEKKAYEVCDQFGDAGLAFLLGHELTHYYEKHAWKESFLQENLSLDNDDAGNIIQRLKSINDGVAHETEADYLGGFLCYTAGYGIFEAGGELIQKLYSAYGLPDTLELYPTLSERVALGERSAKKLKTLVAAFEIANYLFLLGDYSLSYEYYDYVARNYQSREVYNNLGVVSTLSALSYFNPEELKYRYVSELEVSLEGSRDVSETKADKIDRALSQAILHFNAAISLDPDYAPAYLNRANAYALKKEWRKAKFYAEVEAMEVALLDSTKYSKTIEDIKVLLGIIAAETGDEAQARKHFKAAIHGGSRLAAYNLSQLEGDTIMANNQALGVDFTREKLGKFSARRFLKNPPKVKKLASIGVDHQLLANFPDDKQAEVFINRNFETGILTGLVISTDTFDGQLTGGIGKGSSVDAVLEAYGEPAGIVQSTVGEIMVYDNCLFLTENSVVTRIVTSDIRKL